MIRGIRIIYNLSTLDYKDLEEKGIMLSKATHLELLVSHKKKLMIVYLNFGSIELILEGAKESLKIVRDVLGKNFKFIVSKPYRNAIIKQEQAKAKIADKTSKYKISKERIEIDQKKLELYKKAKDYQWEQFERGIQFLDNQIKKVKDVKTQNFLINKKNEAIRMMSNNNIIPIEMIDSERIYFREGI